MTGGAGSGVGSGAERPDEVSDDGRWFAVEERGSTGAVRRAATALGDQLGLAEDRLAALNIAVAELASNLVKHASAGVMLLRPVRADGQAGVEAIAVDSGPGMVDLRLSAVDGHSTSGTLGIGLGAIARQASWYDAHSVPRRGTVLAIQVWPKRPPEPSRMSGLTRPMTGEVVSGDGFAVRLSDGRPQVLMCDGLGHGPLAANAAQAASRAFREAPTERPATTVERLHRALTHTRGAALAVAELDVAAGLVRYSGLGNIAGAVLSGTARRGMISVPGIAGHQGRGIREYVYPLAGGATVLMHTDGIADRWSVGDYPDVLDHSPQVIAATVLRDAGLRRDDAGVVVAQA
jgi:anti-sigma regulatory factor (Ser/Thr protein kinase)